VRRILMALVGMVAGTTLLVGLKAQGLPGSTQVAAGAPLDPGASAGPGGTGGSGADPGQPGGASAAPGSTVPPVSSPGPGHSTGGPGQPTTQPPTGGSTTTAPPATKSYTGVAVAVKTAQSPTVKSSSCGDCHDYAMSITIKVAAGRITSASVAYNTSPGASQSYATKAATALSQSILSAQTWNLGRVSGATYSGNAFELSVKDAMAKAGLPT
jgi:uncharacterized protein with FMN-binding domain